MLPQSPGSSPSPLRRSSTLRADKATKGSAAKGSEARAIARLDVVEPFPAICEALVDASCPGIDDAAERAFGALRQWLADGWVAAWPAPSVGRAPL